MHSVRSLTFGLVAMLGLATAMSAAATSTSADTSAFVGGITVRQATNAGAEGASASAEQTIPSPSGGIFVSASAISFGGALRANGVARGTAPASMQAQAFASWADTFLISAAGYDSSMTGTFSGSAVVSGGLLAEITGRAYADSQSFGDLDLFTDTGFNGGRIALHGSGRSRVGYDTGSAQTGAESYALVFDNVPFTFGRNINLNLQLHVTAETNTLDVGASGRSEADYQHTMSWAGLTEVRDSSNRLITSFSALSAGSGLNYAYATPVPEPSGAWMLALGLLVVLRLKKRSRYEG